MRSITLDQNLDSQKQNRTITFPEKFPDKEAMLSILHKIIENSWKIDMHKDQITNWLDNFNGRVYDAEDERRLALWLLCNFTFYSLEDVNHLCKTLFNKFIHDYVIRFNFSVDSIEKELEHITFSSIGSASESGGMLLYHFRQEAKLPLERFCYPTEILSNAPDTVVFIDDVTLSGDTGLRFFRKHLKDKKFKSIYYLTIISSREAISKLSAEGIIPIYCSLVDGRNKCFEECSLMFSEYQELIGKAKEISEIYGKSIVNKTSEALGYKNGGYCFGFYYNTPNNTLPIFWSNLNNWHPLFPRKEKIRNAKRLHFNARKYI